MKLSAKNIVTSILAVAFLTACAGGRQKQAVAIEPAPGSKQPASDQNQNQSNNNNEQQKPGGQQQQPPGQEQANPGGQDQSQGGVKPPADGVPPSGPSTEGQGQGGQGQGQGSGTTNLSIEAVLEDGVSGTPPSVAPGTTTVGAWDGKSFKGSGKWKVDPVD